MIKLDLLDACKNCIHFEPKLDGVIISTMLGDTTDYTVVCENRDKCKALLEHLQKEVKKNGN